MGSVIIVLLAGMFDDGGDSPSCGLSDGRDEEGGEQMFNPRVDAPMFSVSIGLFESSALTSSDSPLKSLVSKISFFDSTPPRPA